jgi:predicted nucleic acid-binding protein
MIDVLNWQKAKSLTEGVDNDEIGFVALALQNDGWLWTGDRKLANHLKEHGFTKVISTIELYEALEKS